jgi:hypothetical protein
MPSGKRPPPGSTPAGFRAQLLERLRNRARAEKIDAKRLQNRVALEEFEAILGDLRFAGSVDPLEPLVRS